jgi:PAS domain S-box-containing protein
LLLLICLGFFPVLYSQGTNLQFQRFTIEQGLAQNSVFCILQDQKGFMWFGTEQGLNRFDGYTFVVHKFQYDNPNRLSNSYVLSFHEDSPGIFWIGTNGGGLNRFDPENEEFSHFLVDPESIDSLSNIINVVFEDHLKELWIGTGGGGLKKFDRKSKTFTGFPVNSQDPNLLKQNTINAIREDHSGVLWVGTDGGLKQLNRVTNQIDPVGLDDKKVLTLFEDNSRQFWVGTDNGFYRFKPSTREWVHFQVPASEKNFYSANQVKTFYEDRSGIFWIGTEYGLYTFDRQDKTYHSFYADLNNPHGLSGNRVGAIYEDRSGALWIGIKAGGLHKLNRTEQSFTYYYRDPKNPDSLIMRGVFAIYEDREGVLWVGTYGEGLIAFNRKTGEFTNYRNHPGNPNSLSDNRIWALYEDSQGMLWIGTAGQGLNRFNRKTGRFIRFYHQPQNPNSLSSDLISCIIEDREQNLWIATNGGLDKLDPHRNHFTRYQSRPNHPDTLGHNNVYVLIEDRKGILWIGTKGGLSRLDPKNNTFTTYRLFSQYSNIRTRVQPEIFSLWEDRRGVLWIGTTSGLHKFHRENRTFSLYTEKDGLPNDVINGILEDEQGNLWLSTNKGVSKFNPVIGKFKNYGVEDGLQDYEFGGGSYFKSRSGELFFGGLKGFNAFFPGSIKDNPYIPPVVITDFKIFNQSVPIGKAFKGHVILETSITEMDAIQLSYRHHTFSFEYAALNYIHSEKNEYAYMMEGIEDSWNYVGQRRFVTYANLAPGDYTFKVKASNNHGAWNEKGVSLKITVLPPFWETWWFRISVVFLILALVFVVFRVRTRLILKRNRELEETVARRTTALRESEEKYRTVVERAHSGIAIIQDEVIAFHNTQLANLLGYEKTGMTHQPLVQFAAPEKQPGLNDLLTGARNKKRVSGNFETILRHKEGHPIHVEISYGRIRYKKKPALLMFFYDIRMQKLLEEERMKTAKLESTRILAGGIAHDFNNLLTIILGNIELAIGDVKPEDDIYRELSDADMSGRKAADLVRQFITLSKGDAPIKKKEYLQGITREAVHSIIQGSHVTVHFDLPDNLWAVDCDAAQIKQCIENIAVNAKQAAAADGVLEIEAQNEELTPEHIPNKKAGKYVCLTMKDNGVGIAREDLPRIFDPYFSTRDDVTQKGLGLGLAVVQSIISKHDGFIHVTSEVNVGTTVRIFLPAY